MPTRFDMMREVRAKYIKERKEIERAMERKMEERRGIIELVGDSGRMLVRYDWDDTPSSFSTGCNGPAFVFESRAMTLEEVRDELLPWLTDLVCGQAGSEGREG